VDGAGKGAMQNSGVQEWGGAAKCGFFLLAIVCSPNTENGADNSVRVIKKPFDGFQNVQSSKAGRSGGMSYNLGTYLTTPLILRNSHPSEVLQRPESK
jgi:hypothetical protein